jgi:hypothetical protein
MKLSELVSYVCTKSGLLSVNDIDACNLFLSKRYELIYNQYLWKDAIRGVDINFDPVNNADNAEGIVFVPAGIERIVATRTPTNQIKIHGIEDYYRIDYNQFIQTGTPFEYSLLNPLWFIWRGVGGLQVNIAAGPDQALGPCKVSWRDETGTQYVQMLSNGGLLPTTAMAGKARIEVESVFTPITANPVTLTDSLTNAITAGTITPPYTGNRRLQRFRLMSIPTAAMTISVLGKMRFIPLDYQQEEPLIQNLDNCLIAMAMGDMFKRARFPDSEVEPLYTEGSTLLKELAKLETIQAANNSRLIPDAGFGEGYFSAGQMGWNYGIY